VVTRAAGNNAPIGGIKVEAVIERWIQEPLKVPEMIKVSHRQNTSAGRREDFD